MRLTQWKVGRIRKHGLFADLFVVGFFWRQTSWIREFHYPILLDEVTVDRYSHDSRRSDDQYRFRNYGRARIDLPRLENMANAALRHTRYFMNSRKPQ